MRLHRPLTYGVTSALRQIFEEGRYADKVIAQLLKANRKWGSRDRAFVASSVYDIVRWWRLLWNLAFEKDPPAPPFKEERLLRLLGVKLLLEGHSLPDWKEFAGLSADNILLSKEALGFRTAVIQSIPDWLDQLGRQELGEKWESELPALNETAELVIRTNTLLTNRETLLKELEKDGWQPRPGTLSDDAIILGKRGNIFRHPLFLKGYFEVQDEGSQLIAKMLAPEPGMRVVDACAGAGGKALHLASLMQNKGTLIAMDTEAWKLDELKRRAKRNKVHIIQSRPIESSKSIKRLTETADRLLLDVPCSGLGVLRRNPDAKWKLSPEFVEGIKNTQAEILSSYSRMLKPGGHMVYATCSILPSENEGQVQRFLQDHHNFKLLSSKHLLPLEHGTDGFFMALLEKSA
ncbi:MAG: class I SAM-dependent methyltransferase [Saprospiraceae bacterium]